LPHQRWCARDGEIHEARLCGRCVCARQDGGWFVLTIAPE